MTSQPHTLTHADIEAMRARFRTHYVAVEAANVLYALGVALGVVAVLAVIVGWL